jgi:hypothetical protein
MRHTGPNVILQANSLERGSLANVKLGLYDGRPGKLGNVNKGNDTCVVPTDSPMAEE